MRITKLTFAAMTVAAIGFLAGEADAAQRQAALGAVNTPQNVRFTWHGRSYCWYEEGWRGPGWYRCGFALRRGFGWGGPAGWHGWRVGGIGVPAERLLHLLALLLADVVPSMAAGAAVDWRSGDGRSAPRAV